MRVHRVPGFGLALLMVVVVAGCGSDSEPRPTSDDSSSTTGISAERALPVPTMTSPTLQIAVHDSGQVAVIETNGGRTQTIVGAGVGADGKELEPVDPIPALMEAQVVATSSGFAVFGLRCIGEVGPGEEPCATEVVPTVVWLSGTGERTSTVEGPKSLPISAGGAAPAGDELIYWENGSDFSRIDETEFSPLETSPDARAVCRLRSGPFVEAVVDNADPTDPEGSAATVTYRMLGDGSWTRIGEITASNTSGDTTLNRCVVGGFVSDRGVLTGSEGPVAVDALQPIPFTALRAVGIDRQNRIMLQPDTEGGTPTLVGGPPPDQEIVDLLEAGTLAAMSPNGAKLAVLRDQEIEVVGLDR